MTEIPNNVATNEDTFRLWVVQTLTTVQVQLTGQIEDRKDQETRLRDIERTTWKAMGIASVLSSLGTALITGVIRKFIA